MSLGLIVWFDGGPRKPVGRDDVAEVFGDPLRLRPSVPPMSLTEAVRRADWSASLPFRPVKASSSKGVDSWSLVMVSEGTAAETVAVMRIDRKAGRVDGLDLLSRDGAVKRRAKDLVVFVERMAGRYDGRQIRLCMIRTVAAWGGIPLRDQGGVYLLPAARRGEVLDVAAKAEALGLRVGIADAADTLETRRSLSRFAGSRLLAAAEILDDAVDGRISRMRTGALEARRGEAEALRDVAATHAKALGSDGDLGKVVAAVERIREDLAKSP